VFYRFEYDQAIEAECPVFEVMNVCLDTPLNVPLGVNFSSKSIDLCPASNPWPYEFADEVLSHHPHEHFLVLGQMRPRTDDAHIAFEHIDELRKLIDAEFSQPSSGWKHSRIVL
jgi:hypothetical protein